MRLARLAASLVLTVLPCLDAQAPPPLRFEASISLPDVRGRIDHFAVDAGGGRLFVTALGNDTVEIIDLKARKRMHGIAGLHEPQGLLYLPSLHRLYVANGGDETCASSMVFPTLFLRRLLWAMMRITSATTPKRI